jgi:hypothetical protein
MSTDGGGDWRIRGGRTRLIALGGAIAVIVLLGLSTLLVLSCGGRRRPTTATSHASDQHTYQVSINENRKHVYRGVVVVVVSSPADISAGIEVIARVCPFAGRPCPAPVDPAGIHLSPVAQGGTLSTDIGGRVKATLFKNDMKGRISLLGDAVKPVLPTDARPTDWRWAAFADEPGSYRLVLSFNLKLGTSDEDLTAGDTFDIPVVVTESTPHHVWRKAKAAMAQPIVYGAISVGVIGAVGWTFRRLVRGADEEAPAGGDGKGGDRVKRRKPKSARR